MDTNRIMLIVVAVAAVGVLAWYIYPELVTTPDTSPAATAPATTGPKTTQPKQ